MMSYKFARRSFLRACGGSAALLLPLLRSIEARAQGLAAPLRFLVIHHPLGTSPGGANWRPNATATTTSFTLPFESAPFAPLQKYMVMVDGMNIVTASKAGDGGQNTHEGGIVAMMTGVPTLGKIGEQDHCAAGPSIDQMLLAQSPLLGGPTQTKPTMFGSLQLAADIRSDRDEVAPRVLSYKPPLAGQSDISLARQPLYAETQPLNVFNRVFGGSLPSGINGAQVLAQKLSVLDFMRSDLARMQTLIPSSEKDRLLAHGAAIQNLESTLRATYGGAMSSCAKPPMPANYAATASGQSQTSTVFTKLSGVDYYVNGSNAHPHLDLGQNQLRLIKAAFACDLVRVATFMWSAGTNWVVFPGTFQGATIKGNLQSTPHHPPSHSDPSGDPMTRDWLNQINTFYSQATATVLQELATQPDIDGNMLIDNTVIVYVTEVARAFDHNQQNMPLIIFGGKNTRVKGGTFLKVTGGPLSAQTGGSGNRPFNDVWLALLPIFGINGVTSLGSANQSTGPLAGIFS
jgi:Protein of unknown function (DUF1552)